jgi:hypothetical protein
MTTRRLGLLTALVVGLGVFIFFFERHQPTTQQRLDRGDVLWDINEGKIGSITVTRGNETLEFVRAPDDSWRMTKPEDFPADASLLSSLVFDLARPQRMGEASESVSGPDYGLMKPRVVVTVGAKQEKGKKPESHTLSLGNEVPGTDSVAARVQGENRIVFVRTTLASDLLKPAESFWSRKVFTGSSADVARITIARGRGQMEFEKKKESWWMSRPVADLADATAIDRLVGDLLGENASEFLKVADSDLAGAGLQPPIFTVTMTIAKKPQTLEIGASRADGKTVYARANGKVFAIDSSVTEELSREADAYRETRLVRFDNSNVKSFTATEGGRPRTLVRDGPDWTEAGKAVPSAGVEDVLTAISAVPVKDYLSAAESARVEPETETAGFKIDLKSGDSWTISVRPGEVEKRLAVKVSGRPAMLAVESADFDRVVAALKKLAPASQTPAAPAPRPAPKKK